MKCFPDSGFIMERVTMKKFILIFYGIFGCVALIFASFLLFVTDRYRADDMLIADLTAGDTAVSQSSEAEGVTVFSPQEGSDWGFIFYPGAMVESNAYSPLLTKMADRGVKCFNVEMPCYLAFLGQNKADSIISAHPEIKHWYIGGHSLGGYCAAEYAFANHDKLEGVVLLAAYTEKDLSSCGLKAVSVYGSCDKVLSADAYRQYRSLLPEDTSELVIEGGCHSYFGAYGLQKGDGEAEITLNEQLTDTADFVCGKIKER